MPASRRTRAARVRVASFQPQIGAGCRVLVLGTVPSLKSLEMQQSYAHPHNLFWPFMGILYGAGPDLPYAERIARLHAAGVGIWDVLKHCERPGSLDSSILVESEVPNDIPGLLEAYPTIEAIALNGAKAQQVFARRIGPMIRPARLERTRNPRAAVDEPGQRVDSARRSSSNAGASCCAGRPARDAKARKPVSSSRR